MYSKTYNYKSVLTCSKCNHGHKRLYYILTFGLCEDSANPRLRAHESRIALVFEFHLRITLNNGPIPTKKTPNNRWGNEYQRCTQILRALTQTLNTERRATNHAQRSLFLGPAVLLP